ncbi:MAG: 50S ribosomal protein L3 [Chloroflexi bacterium]|nr:MAG: 50S ribosomal protein L3 [Chloroflexota bacterium]
MTEEQAQSQTQQTASTDAPEIANPFLLGRKVGMLQHFRPDGTVVGATIISAEPNVVTFVRTRERDGYTAVQIGYGAIAERRMTRPALGHLKGLSPLRELREIRLDDVSGFERGQQIGVGRFAAGDKVHITGVSKGKGFQGPVHLHHFKTGPKTHGSDHYKRQGSVGAGTTPGRVLKGMRMARKMGVDRVTVKNLEILRSDADRGVLIVKGAIPGARNAIVLVRKA